MTTLDSELFSPSRQSQIHLKHSRHSSLMPRIIMGPESRHYETTREENTCLMPLFSLLQMLELSDSILLETGLSRMERQRGLTGPRLRGSLLCWLRLAPPG